MKTINGIKVEGSQKEYNKGFVRAFMVHKDSGNNFNKTMSAIDFLICATGNEDYRYGLNDASRVIALMNIK